MYIKLDLSSVQLQYRQLEYLYGIMFISGNLSTFLLFLSFEGLSDVRDLDVLREQRNVFFSIFFEKFTEVYENYSHPAAVY